MILTLVPVHLGDTAGGSFDVERFTVVVPQGKVTLIDKEKNLTYVELFRPFALSGETGSARKDAQDLIAKLRALCLWKSVPTWDHERWEWSRPVLSCTDSNRTDKCLLCQTVDELSKVLS